MSGELGVSPGTIGSATNDDLRNESATIADQPIQPTENRIQPREVATGVTRGTQTIMNTDGSYVTLGLIPDGGTDFGIAFFNADGTLISKSTGDTDYKYDKLTGRNYYQNGLLPDGTYGEIVAKDPYNVADVYS